MEIPALGGCGLLFNGPVLILFQKIFSGTGMLPVRVAQVKNLCHQFQVGCVLRTINPFAWRAKTSALSD
jgi:hypothetical protein